MRWDKMGEKKHMAKQETRRDYMRRELKRWDKTNKREKKREMRLN